MLFAGGATLTAFLQSVGPNSVLGDTLLAVAAMHLEAFVLLFGLLRVWVGEPVTSSSLRGLLVAGVGAHVFGYGCAWLGREGMPRRYAAYLGRFNALQVVTSIGALVLLVGLVLILLRAGSTAQKRRR